MHLLWIEIPIYVYNTRRFYSPNTLNLPLQLLLCLCLPLLLGFALCLTLQLIRSTNGDILGTEITEQVLENSLNQPATSVVDGHQHGQRDLELVAERHQAKLLVDLGNEFGRAGESHSGRGNETPVHGLVFADGLAERTALVVDREGGDLLDQLEQVNGAVQEGRLEFALEINVTCSPANVLAQGINR